MPNSQVIDAIRGWPHGCMLARGGQRSQEARCLQPGGRIRTRDLSADNSVPPRGAVWIAEPVAARGALGRGEHRRRMRTRLTQRLPSISRHCFRVGARSSLSTYHCEAALSHRRTLGNQPDQTGRPCRGLVAESPPFLRRLTSAADPARPAPGPFAPPRPFPSPTPHAPSPVKSPRCASSSSTLVAPTSN